MPTRTRGRPSLDEIARARTGRPLKAILHEAARHSDPEERVAELLGVKLDTLRRHYAEHQVTARPVPTSRRMAFDMTGKGE